jgi:hypothetical protein
MTNTIKPTTNFKETQTMLRYQTIKSKYFTLRSILTTALYLTPVLLCSLDAMAEFNLDNGAKAIAEPIKKMVNDYYPVGIFATGAIGALLKSQGDLRERMVGFGLGALAGGLTVIGVKAGLGI